MSAPVRGTYSCVAGTTIRCKTMAAGMQIPAAMCLPLLDFPFPMRMRLFLRRLTVSAPRMSVRSTLPWPLRWLSTALLLGFSAALALWAFDFGKQIAGLDGGRVEYIAQLERQVDDLKRQVERMKSDRDEALSQANTASTLIAAEQAAQERLTVLNRQLEADNQRLRDDLGFFERLIPAEGSGVLAIRGLQAEVLDGHQVRWQVLVIQPLKNAPEFNGRLELSFTGLQAGRPWTGTLPEGPQPIKLRQYARAEGIFEVPPQTLIRGLSVRVMQGDTVKATQSIKL